MEQHGDESRSKAYVIIPARYASVRLPGKMLREIAGKPLIVHTMERAAEASGIDSVIVACDDERIARAVENAGGQAVLTSIGHMSGTDRIAEAAGALEPGSLIVNVQGDEPMIAKRVIEQAVEAARLDPNADIVTTCEPIETAAQVVDPNCVKVAVNTAGYAIYFSRSPIPFPREAVLRHGSLEEALEAEPEAVRGFRKHTGIYVYRREFLIAFAGWPAAVVERNEMLEQLRALDKGARIRVIDVDEQSVGVDVEDDLERVRGIIEGS